MAWKIVDYNPFDWFGKKPEEGGQAEADQLGRVVADDSETGRFSQSPPPDLTKYGDAYDPFKSLAATADSPEVALKAPVKPGGALDAQQFKEVAKGIPGGAVGMVGTTLQGAGAVPSIAQSNVLKNAQARVAMLDRLDRGEKIKPNFGDLAGAAAGDFGYSALSPEQRQAERAKLQGQIAGYRPTPLAEQPLYQAGQKVSDYGKTILPAAPGYEQGWGRQVGEGLGSLVAGIPFGALGRIPSAIFFGASGMGEAGTRAVQYDQAEKRAGRPGLTQDQINAAALYGVGPGTTDMLPLETLLGRLRVPAAGRSVLAQAIARIGGQAFIEGMQEGGQQFLQNLIARDVYNENQPLGEDVAGNVAVGGGVGAIAEGAKQAAALALRGLTGARSRGSQAGPGADPFLNPEVLPPEGPVPSEPIDVTFEDLVPANRRLAPPEPAPQAPPPSTPETSQPVPPQAEGALPDPQVAAAPDFTPAEAPAQRGVDVLQFIRANGGLKPSRELGGMDAQRYPGLINQNGLDADKMREKMVEAGYLQESGPDEPAVTTPADVYDLLSRSISGERIVPRADLEADQAYSDKKWQREFARELKSNEQTFIYPEIDKHEPALARGLRQAYAGLTPDERQDVILRNRRGEDIVDLLEEKTTQNELYYALGVPLGPDREDQSGFYSKALETAKTLKRQSGNGTGFLNDLLKAGVKPAEIQAIGLDRFLNSKGSQWTFSRQEVEDFIRERRVPLEIAQLRTAESPRAVGRRLFGKDWDQLTRLQQAEAQAEAVGQTYEAQPKWGRYSLDPGNPTYREDLLKLPRGGLSEKLLPDELKAREEAQRPFLERLNALHARMTDMSLPQSVRADAYEEMKPLQNQMWDAMLKAAPDPAEVEDFTSGHWQGYDNVLSHIRSQMLTDTQGRRVFNLDELQSDWGQKIRDSDGARDEERIKQTQAALGRAEKRRRETGDSNEAWLRGLLGDAYQDQHDHGQGQLNVISVSRAYEKEIRQQAKERMLTYEDATSDSNRISAELRTMEKQSSGHPLVNDTKQWVSTALRRVIQMAVDSGADGISITPGAVQNARYQLSNEVQALRYVPDAGELYMVRAGIEPGGGDYFELNGNDWEHVGDFSPEELPGVVGREMSEKLLAQPLTRDEDISHYDYHVLSDLGSVEIGGSGMKATYDKMYPDMLGSMLKKLDPSIKPEKTTYDLRSKDPTTRREVVRQTPDQEFTFFPLTEKAKDKLAAEGQPLFALQGFYSPAIKATEKIKQEKGTPDQWWAMISKTPGIRQEELQWMGLKEWLDAMEAPLYGPDGLVRDIKTSVTKREVLDFMAQHQMELEDKILGGKPPASYADIDMSDYEYEIDERAEEIYEELREERDDEAIREWEEQNDPENIDPVVEPFIGSTKIKNIWPVVLAAYRDGLATHNQYLRDQYILSPEIGHNVRRPRMADYLPEGFWGEDQEPEWHYELVRSTAGNDINGDGIYPTYEEAIDASEEHLQRIKDEYDDERDSELQSIRDQDYHDLRGRAQREARAEIEERVREEQADNSDGDEADDDDSGRGLPAYGGPTQHKRYSIPGGKDYRELLVTFPQLEGYSSAHFQDKELVHIRFDSRTGPNGDRVLFVHEIQSDLHQRSRAFGFGKEGADKAWNVISKGGWTDEKEKARSESLNAQRESLARQIGKYFLPGSADIDPAFADQYSALSTEKTTVETEISELSARAMARVRQAEKYRSTFGSRGAPEAPYTGNAWWELGFKRAVQYAVEENFDGIALTTPSQIMKASYTPESAAKQFYGQNLPKFIDKYVKKWGVTQDTVQLSGIDDYFTAHTPPEGLTAASAADFFQKVVESHRNSESYATDQMKAFVADARDGMIADYAVDRTIYENPTLRVYAWEGAPGLGIKPLYTKTVEGGNPYYRISDAMRKDVYGGGQPLALGPGSPESDLQLRRNIRTFVKMGRSVSIPYADAVLDVLEPYYDVVPDNMSVAALSKVSPVPGRKDRVIATFKDNFGQDFELEGPLDLLLSRRAWFGDDGGGNPTLFFARFNAVGAGDSLLIGEMRHEVIHALRQASGLPAALWRRLLDHAKNLQVLESDFKTYLQRIGSPYAKDAKPGVSTLEYYQEAYGKYKNPQESIDEEYVAHLAELYSHGELLPMEVGPVQDILDDIFAGKYSKTSVAPTEVAAAISDEDSPAAVTKTPEFKAWFRNSKVVDDRGRPKLLYHGAGRADRIVEAGFFDPKRATSGPMAFFTDDPEIASNYAKGKADTSLRDEGDVADYFTASQKDLGRSRGRAPVTIEQSWYWLTPQQREVIADRATRVGYRNIDQSSGPFTLHPEGTDGVLSPDHYRYLLQNARGNHLQALREMWHDSGDLIGNEWVLKEIYHLAGYPHPISTKTAPWHEGKGVIPAYMSMQNPVLTSDKATIDAIIARLEEAFKRDRTRVKTYPGRDGWDKNTRYTPKQWLEQLKEDNAKGTNSYAWTSIPDKVTDVLKQMGYDGVIDTGAKGVVVKLDDKVPEEGHTVYVPFYPSQIKSPFNRGTFDPDDKRISYALAGRRAIGAPKADLDRGAAMEKQGASPEKIWQETGTYRGKEGKQRWEIDDSKAKIINLDKILSVAENKPVKRGLLDRMTGRNKPVQQKGGAKVRKDGSIRHINVPLINLLDHPQLYNAYPFLRQMRVDLNYYPDDPMVSRGALGKLHFKGRARIYRPIQVDAGSPETLKSVLLHEIQHYIQDKEDFAAGANQGTDDISKLKTADPLNMLAIPPQYDPARGQVERMEKEPAGTSLLSMTQPERMALRYMQAQDEGDDMWTGIRAKSLEESMITRPEDYKNSAGEAEANAVMDRMNLSAAARRASLPEVATRKDIEASDTRTRDLGAAMDEAMRRANTFRAILQNWKQARDVGGGVKAVRTEESRVDYMKQPDQPLVEMKLYQTAGGSQLGFTQDFLDLPYSEQKQVMDQVIRDAGKTFNVSVETQEIDNDDVYDSTVDFWARYDPRKVAFDLRLYRDKVNQLIEEQFGPDAEIVEFLPHEASVKVITPEAQERYDKARQKIDETWSKEHDARMKLVMEYGSMDDAREKASPEEMQRFRDAKEKHSQALASPDAEYPDNYVDLSSIFGDRTYRRIPRGIDPDVWNELLVEEQLAANGIKLKPSGAVDFSDLIPR